MCDFIVKEEESSRMSDTSVDKYNQDTQLRSSAKQLTPCKSQQNAKPTEPSKVHNDRNPQAKQDY